MPTRRDWLLASAAGTLALTRDAAAADHPTHIPNPPADARLGPAKTLDGYFPFVVPKTLQEWEVRKTALREHLQVSLGLWPMPAKTPLNAVVHGAIQREGYTVEKVFFQSLPGHVVSGNLYRPAGVSKAVNQRPGVLFAHGHWRNGRMYEAPPKEVAAQLKSGGETVPEAAKYPLQALPANLALQGYVVFAYDMIGYADSTTLDHQTAFADAAGELNLQSIMGLQTWNSVRALDFLAELPDVNAKQLGMTGASGGGTQTFILGALDDRIKVAVPAVMVSTGMQGGCVCENCSYLRIPAGNVEFAAMFAPRPLAMTAADDWTKELLTKGFPELKKLYELYRQPGNVAAQAWPEFGHNYNRPAREFMYAFLAKHLKGFPNSPVEVPFQPIPPAQLSVYDATHPRPKTDLPAAELRKQMTAASDARREKLSPAEFRNVVTSAYRVMIGGGLPAEVAIRRGPLETKYDGFVMHRAVLGRVGGADAVPFAGVYADKAEAGAVIWVHPKGKESLWAGDALAPPVQDLVKAGYAVIAPDVFGTGQLTPKTPIAVDAKFAGYTFGYNRPRLAQQVQDILTAITFAKTIAGAKTTHLVGCGTVGLAALIAKVLAGDAVAKTAVDLDGFDFAQVKSTADPRLLPGAVKYGGCDGLLAATFPGAILAGGSANAADHRTTDSLINRAGESRTFAGPFSAKTVVAFLTK